MNPISNNVIVLDAGVLIALALGEPATKELSERIAEGKDTFACTEIALSELSYILCRRIGWDDTWSKVESLLKSSAIRIVPTNMLWAEAAKIKCIASIALPDCFTIATARLVNGTALFARKERELLKAIKDKQISDRLEFM